MRVIAFWCRNKAAHGGGRHIFVIEVDGRRVIHPTVSTLVSLVSGQSVSFRLWESICEKCAETEWTYLNAERQK